MLDHFLAPLVLEIDIDVRRLVALARHEALEKRIGARGIHFGDAEAVAHHGVGRRTAPLAEDALGASELHDVVNGEEEMLVAQIRHELELVLDLLAHVLRHAARKTAGKACFGQLAQIARRRIPRRHDLVGILVTQDIERKIAALSDTQRFGEQFRRINSSEPRYRAQMPFGIGMERVTRRMHRDAEADRGQDILQHPARRHVHMDVTCGNERQAGALRELLQQRQTRAIIRPAQQLHRDPRTLRKSGGNE